VTFAVPVSLPWPESTAVFVVAGGILMMLVIALNVRDRSARQSR
jgi:hypothetical protein